MTEPAPPPLTADELDAQLAWHAAGCGYCENSDSPCMYSRTIATAAALRTQLEQARFEIQEAKDMHLAAQRGMRRSIARETALREALENCEVWLNEFCACADEVGASPIAMIRAVLSVDMEAGRA